MLLNVWKGLGPALGLQASGSFKRILDQCGGGHLFGVETLPCSSHGSGCVFLTSFSLSTLALQFTLFYVDLCQCCWHLAALVSDAPIFNHQMIHIFWAWPKANAGGLEQAKCQVKQPRFRKKSELPNATKMQESQRALS